MSQTPPERAHLEDPPDAPPVEDVDDLSEPPGDPVLTGDAVIDEALVQLDAVAGRPLAEHPAAFEQVHRVLRDALSGRDADTGRTE